MALFLNLETATEPYRQSVIKDVYRFLEADEQHQVFYIVPDNQQLTMEFEVLDGLSKQDADQQAGGATGMMRLQVFSFKRLAWYLGVRNKDTISKIGLTMVIKKALEELKGELTAFKKESHYLSFQQQLYALFSEFDRGTITVDYLKHLLKELQATDPSIEDSTFKRNEYRKLEEILAIFESYEKYLRNHKLQEANLYEKLLQEIERNDLSNTMIVLEGFEYFQADEYSVVRALIENTDKVILSMLAESKDIEQGENYDPTQSVFTNSHYIYKQLAQLVPDDTDIRAFKVNINEKSNYSLGIQTLDAWWRSQNFSASANEPNGNEGPSRDDESFQLVREAVDIWQVESLRVEADQAASAIYHYVSEGKYRYRDFQILAGQLDQYQSLLVAALEQNDIPYYIDQPDSMAKHPLARFLSSLHAISKYDWRYEDVFSLLKTELFKPRFYREREADDRGQNRKFRELMDRIENVVLARDYQGRQWWKADEEWQFDEINKGVSLTEDPQMVQFRNAVYQPIQRLVETWKEKPTAKVALSALYDFMTRPNSVRDTMQSWEVSLTNAGEVERAKRQEQVWNRFVQTLDEYIELFGDETFDIDSFFSLLLSAFDNNYYRMVPPTLDSVRISEYGDVPLAPKKVSILLGMTDQALPNKHVTTSLLDDTTRDWLNTTMRREQSTEEESSELHFLDPTAQQQYSNEKFTFYQLLTSATDHLILSYPYNPSSANEKISPFLQLLIDHFSLKPSLHAEQRVEGPSEWVLGNGAEQLQQLVIKQQQFKELPAEWQAIAKELGSEPDYKRLLEEIDLVTNTFTNLTPAQAKILYGGDEGIPVFSISQLELYNKDPFSYFLRYGLRLKERQRFEVDHLQTGDYFHRVLEFYFDDWPNIGSDQIEKALEKATEEYEIFNRSGDHKDFQFRHQQLDETLKLVARYETLRLQALNIKGIETEKKIRKENLETEKGNVYNLVGKIDRVDHFNFQDNPDTSGFQIIDYKSSVKKDNLHLSKLEDGASLQLFTYFVSEWEDLGGEDNKALVPIGFFYQEIGDLIDLKKKITDDATYSEDISKDTDLLEKAKSARLVGYFLNDAPQAQEIVDKEIFNETKDEKEKENLKKETLKSVYDLDFKKDGGFTGEKKGNKKYLTIDHFKLIKKRVYTRIRETVDEIISGEIKFSPLTFENYTKKLPSLKEYKAIARYDATTDDIEKRSPSKEKDQAILKKYEESERSEEEKNE